MSTFSSESTQTGSNPSGGNLQFERAEYSGGSAGPVCAGCKQPVVAQYHQLNGRVFCGACRVKVEQSIEKLRQSGSLGRAALFGLGAAVLGSLLYYGVSAATGYEFGLIAVVVGLMVGKAVRKGSGTLGGRRYQALAMALTYFSIASTYVPPITKAFYAEAAKHQAAENAAPVQAAPGTAAAPRKAQLGVVPFYTLMFALALAAPVLAGFRNILGMIIIGFGLWEAWKFNRRVEVKFSGPFAVAPAGT